MKPEGPSPNLSPFDSPSGRRSGQALTGRGTRSAGGMRYRMPAEWQPHLASYMTWPHNHETWPGKFEPVPAAFARIVATLSGFEPARLLVNETADPAVMDAVRSTLENAGANMLRLESLSVPAHAYWLAYYGRSDRTDHRP